MFWRGCFEGGTECAIHDGACALSERDGKLLSGQTEAALGIGGFGTGPASIIEPSTTKNYQGRLIPLVKEVTEALWQWKQWTLHRYPACPWVCHFRGERLERVPKSTWGKACERVGIKGKLFHDLRRTAVRNMVRAGISERVAMAITGHRTRSVLDRYDIVSEADLLNAGGRLVKYLLSEGVTSAPYGLREA